MAVPANEDVARAIEQGRAAWPGVEVEPARLAAFLADRPASHLADLYLACACAAGDPAALAAFDARVLPGVAGSLRRLALPADVASEVHQRLRAHLLVGEPPRIAEYQGRGPLLAWVRIVAVRLGLQWKRATRSDERRTEALAHEPSPPVLDPALELLRARHGPLFRSTFTAALAELTVEQRNLLQLHLLEDLSLAEIGALHRVSKSTAARWLTAAREALDTGIRRRLQAALGLPAPEVDSLIAALQSRLELSVERLLADQPPQAGG